MAKQNIPQDEEIDLGSLFKIIGKGISNVFKAIGKFLKGILHNLILLLLFIRNHALKLGLAIFIGAVIGLYLDLTKPKQYSSTMIVEPNFKSALQLYQNIDFYHELVKQKDSNLLAEIFKIPVKEAASLKGFFIEPIRNENEKYEFFDDFIEEVDTATVRNIDIKEFKKSFTEYDYKYHKIKVKSLSNTIFNKLNLPIINSIENNPYFDNQKKINNQNLLQNEKVLVKSLQEVDTLRRIYNEVLITEAKKAEMGTNITLAQGIKKTDELELFNESLKLNKELIENNKEKAETTEILNIVSDFSRIGQKERSIIKKMTFILGLGFGVLMLVFILLRQLNTYLINYKK
ncbi:MAG: hypothetical protein KJO83_04275 [Bacteroidia bacterium]|nr:hypothetical protein [Bacteroidia bacterium]